MTSAAASPPVPFRRAVLDPEDGVPGVWHRSYDARRRRRKRYDLLLLLQPFSKVPPEAAAAAALPANLILMNVHVTYGCTYKRH